MGWCEHGTRAVYRPPPLDWSQGWRGRGPARTGQDPGSKHQTASFHSLLIHVEVHLRESGRFLVLSAPHPAPEKRGKHGSEKPDRAWWRPTNDFIPWELSSICTARGILESVMEFDTSASDVNWLNVFLSFSLIPPKKSLLCNCFSSRTLNTACYVMDPPTSFC